VNIMTRLGWVRTTIGDVTTDAKQHQPMPYEEFTYIDISSIDRETKRIQEPQKIIGANASSRARKVLETGDILVSMTRPNLNAVALVPDYLNNAIASTGFDVLRPVLLDPRWLFYIVRSPEFISAMSDLVQGALYPAVRSQDIRAYSIPLAPLQEQGLICDKLDTICTKIETCLARLERVLFKLNEYREKVLNSAVHGELTADWRMDNDEETSGFVLLDEIREEHKEWWLKNQMELMQKSGKQPRDNEWQSKYIPPESVDEEGRREIPNTWAWASGLELIEPGTEIVYGIVQPGPKLSDGVPYVRGMDIENGKILLSQLMKTSREIASRYSRSELKAGDVLLGIIRSTKVALVPEELTGGNITQGTARFRSSRVIRSTYLAKVFEASNTQNWLHSHYRGIDMPGLNLADVRRVPIPLPPLAEQDEIVERLERSFAQADQVEVRCKNVRDQVDRLSSAFLDRAFSGKLVRYKEVKESAGHLLLRIQGEREARLEQVKLAAKNRKSKMTKITREALREAILALPKDNFTMRDIQHTLAGDYDTLRDFLFELLDEVDAVVSQVFDEESREIRLVRRFT